jgi:hypothetical protein
MTLPHRPDRVSGQGPALPGTRPDRPGTQRLGDRDSGGRAAGLRPPTQPPLAPRAADRSAARREQRVEAVVRPNAPPVRAVGGDTVGIGRGREARW